MRKSICPIIALTVFSTLTAFSQEAFSLIDINKMVLNPAFTASDTAFKHDASIYTKTYTNSDLPGSTNNSFIGTYQMRLDKIHSGVGIMVNYNYVSFGGVETNNQIAAKLYYRYIILPGLSVGADAGLVNLNSRLAISGLVFNGTSSTYVSYAVVTSNSFDFDAGAGILYQLKYFYAGFTMDHITKPMMSYPFIDNISITRPMLNYQGIAYNWSIGGNIPIGKCGIELNAYYYQLYTLTLNATFESPHFFVGFSTIQDNNNENRIFEAEDSYYYSVMGGIKVYHKKIKVSFAYNFYQNSDYDPLNSTILEGGVSYSF